jgi:hypothetical protein
MSPVKPRQELNGDRQNMLTQKFILISEILGGIVAYTVAYQPTVLANPITALNTLSERDSEETAIRVAIPSGIASESLSTFPGQLSHRLTAADLTDNYTDCQTLGNAETTAQLPQGRQLFDIQGNWAQTFIESLAVRDIIRGFPDGTFRPEAPVTRAEFAAMIRKAFPQDEVIRDGGQFADVAITHWAYNAILEAYRMGFIQGYPGNTFEPDQNISRSQVLIALANGLKLTTSGSSNTSSNTNTILNTAYLDSNNIPDFGRDAIAAATENGLVVNYPNVNRLNPLAIATRAEVAAFLHQALVKTGQLPQISATNQASAYIVGYQPATNSEPINFPTPNPENTADSDLDEAEIEALREQLRIPSLPVVLMPSTLGAAASPGSSSGSPTAFGADFGSVFTGASFQERTRFTSSSDGAVSAGFGLGNATKAFGLEVALSVLDLTSRGGDDQAFDRGSVSLKLHRRLPNNFAIAVGYENALVWGFTDAGSSFYGVGSKIFQFQDSPRQPFSSLTVSLGVGNGRFRTEDDFNADKKTVNVFGSAGLRVLEPVSVIADWTGQDLTLGASIAPFRNIPIVITPAIADVTGSAGDGSRFILGVGYSYSFSD